MKKLLSIIVLGLLLCGNSFADLVQSEVKQRYKINNKILAITNNGFLDEVYLCNSSIKNCALINKHFSFIEFAKECEGVQTKNIYFAVNKEHFFMGGINENAPLRIYDLEGNVYGSAPNLDYAKQFCKFY